MLSGEPRGAFEHYARSLEAAQARGDQLQVLHDLEGVANALATVHEDTAALEVAGLAEAHGKDLGRPATAIGEHLVGYTLADAEERVGAAVAADRRARGRAVSAGNRVTVACQLAGARQPA